MEMLILLLLGDFHLLQLGSFQKIDIMTVSDFLDKFLNLVEK